MPRPTLLLGAAAGMLLACADAEDQFRDGRLHEGCDRTWPVCTTVAGCLAGNEQYLEGRFPGATRFVVRTSEPAMIEVALFLRTRDAIGDTRIEWNEAGCGTKHVETLGGLELFNEMEATGEVRRGRPVYQAGDHLIEIASDATASYLLKVDVSPLVR